MNVDLYLLSSEPHRTASWPFRGEENESREGVVL